MVVNSTLGLGAQRGVGRTQIHAEWGGELSEEFRQGIGVEVGALSGSLVRLSEPLLV
jgi:hypothetical protein